jgi:outer membrane protein assembly factor BamA
LLNNQQFIGNNTITSDELASLLPQKSNKKFLRVIRLKLWIYNKASKKYKKSLEQKVFENKISEANATFNQKSKNLSESSAKYQKLKAKRDKEIEKYESKIINGNWVMTSLGEPPVYYSEELANKNIVKIQKYLFNKGFFNATVSFIPDTIKASNQINVKYFINEQKPYQINTISQVFDDKAIKTLIEANNKDTKIKINEQFNEANLSDERSRIEILLRNNGYFQFNRNQIKYKVQYLPEDPTSGVNIKMEFLSSNDESASDKAFQIGKVEFIVDATNNSNNLLLNKIDTLKNNGITYLFVGKKFSTKFLYKKIFIRPGELYSQTNQFETQKALQNLDQFKFANPSFDTSDNKLNVKIYTLPLEKYQFTGEGGLNIFDRTPGPFLNASLKIRNIFGGLESLENTFRVGYEGQNDNRSVDVGFNSTINIPQFFLPWNFTSLDKYNPRTQLGVGFNYADRFDYKRLNFKLAANYNWQQTQKRQFNFSLVDINLINTPFLSNSFESILDSLKTNGNNLKESFGKSFVSSISGSYVYNDNFLGQSQKGKYLRLFAELGGNTLNFNKKGEIGFVNNLLGNNLNYFKFVRILADFRRFVPLSSTNSKLLAFRLNTGLSISYKDSSEVLPYEKYLFAGGSYSLRAWEPRRLGLNRNFGPVGGDRLNYSQEQPGNLLIESSIEYRFPIIKLYGQLNGAWFLDMGNVWTIPKASILKKESDFNLKNFFNQIAVGTGFGLRYDFDYFVIRLDAAAKVVEPLLNEKRFVFDDFFMKNKDANFKLNWNVGIGYPF